MFRKILECLLFGLGNLERGNEITWTLKAEIFQALLFTKSLITTPFSYHAINRWRILVLP